MEPYSIWCDTYYIRYRDVVGDHDINYTTYLIKKKQALLHIVVSHSEINMLLTKLCVKTKLHT